MPGETMITDAASTAAPAAGTPAAAPAPAAAAAPAAAGAPATFDAATGKPVDDGAAGAGAGAAGAGDGKGNESGEKTPEQKVADEATAKAAEEAAAKAAGAPEKYEPFTAPEGAALDAAVITKFEEAARALNLPQDKAQQLINEMAPVMAARQAEQMQQLSQEWHAASAADKEFGGDKLAENLGYATKALNTFASEELKGMLRETGLGNHPELVRFMVRAGKAIGEDKIVTGGTPASAANRSAADVLYGDSAKKK